MRRSPAAEAKRVRHAGPGIGPVKESALGQRGVVQHVLSFAEPNSFLFAAGVSRLWRESWLAGHNHDDATANRLQGAEANAGDDEAAVPLSLAGRPQLNRTSLKTAVASVARISWALEMGLEWSDKLTKAAAQAGASGLEVLKWGLAHGHIRGGPQPLHTSVLCYDAATAGQLQTVQWARANGCPWHEHHTCSAAALKVHVDVIEWARANGCPWNPGDNGACKEAAEQGAEMARKKALAAAAIAKLDAVAAKRKALEAGAPQVTELELRQDMVASVTAQQDFMAVVEDLMAKTLTAREAGELRPLPHRTEEVLDMMKSVLRSQQTLLQDLTLLPR